MATYLLLPGFGGQASEVVATTADSVAHYTNSYDLSRCSHVAAQVSVWAAGTLTLLAQQSFDNQVTWADLGSAVTVVAGDVLRYDAQDGPLGVVRFKLVSSDTAANATIKITGFPNPVKL